jgi:hypothetical protein
MAIHQLALHMRGGRSAWGPRTVARTRMPLRTHCCRPLALPFALSVPWDWRRMTLPMCCRMSRSEHGVTAPSVGESSCRGSLPSLITRRVVPGGAGRRYPPSGAAAQRQTRLKGLAMISTMRWEGSRAANVRLSPSDTAATSRLRTSPERCGSVSLQPSSFSLGRAHHCGTRSSLCGGMSNGR